MSYLLDAANRSQLLALAQTGTLLAFDFDGTLAPITPDRHAAHMTERTAARFAALCRRRSCAVISGRGRDDVAGRLGDAVPVAIVGNHGAEHGNSASAATLALLHDVVAHVGALRSPYSIDIEDKRFSVALHLRAGDERTSRAVHQRLASFGSRIRVVPGHNVINVSPAAAATKGDALVRLMHEFGPARALFVGDDVTDEDVFRVADPRVTGVRVGFSPDSAAPYYLAAQEEIDQLLALLLALDDTESVPPV